MTSLFDTTIQHSGWAASNFHDGGWVDRSPPVATGLIAGSAWASSLNGLAIDMAIRLVEVGGPEDTPLWFNIHTVGPIQVASAQPGYVVGPNTRLWSYTRVPLSNQQILWRCVISDLATTPPPSSPPCQYGTQIKAGTPVNLPVTLEIVQQIFAAVSAETVVPLFVPVIGFNLAVGDLCSRQPLPFPVLSGNPGLNSL